MPNPLKISHSKWPGYPGILRRLIFLLICAVALGCGELVPPPVEEEKVSFYEVDAYWADSLLNTLTLEEKINQLLLLEASQFDSSMLSGDYAGIILNSNVSDLLTASNVNTGLDLPSFLGSNSTLFGGLLNNKEVQLNHVYGLSDHTLDSLLKLENDVNNYLGINLYLGKTSNSDSLFDPFYHYSERAQQVRNKRLKANFEDSTIHIMGTWSLPTNDTTPLSSEQETKNLAIQALKDSGMLAIAFEEKNINGNSRPMTFRNSLKSDLDFEGLIVSEPIELTDSNGLENAFNMGADLIHVTLEDSLRIQQFKQRLVDKVAAKTINETDINNRVRKTLLAKTWMRKQKDSLSMQEYQSKFYVALTGIKQLVHKESIVLVKNDKNRVPFSDLLGLDPCLIKYGRASYSSFFRRLNKYENVVAKRASKGHLNPNDFKRYGNLILALHETLDSNSSKDLLALSKLDASRKLVIVNLDHPENLTYLRDYSTVIQVFGTTRLNEQKVAEAIYGGFALSGQLPMQYAGMPAGHGLSTTKTRLEYSIPEEGGVHSDSLLAIRSIARQMIFSHTSPGCQVMAIKDGKVIYQKSFGHHTYDKIIPVNNNDVYDLASVTKITATTPAFMRFYEQSVFQLDDSLGVYLPDSLVTVLGRRSNFHDITFRELLSHKSGAPAGLKILPYIQYQNDSVGKWDAYFCDEPNTCYDVALADGFYLDHDHLDTLWLLMNKTWLNPVKPYKYSDINMNMLYMLMKSKIPSQTFSRYVDSTFYEPLGLRTLGYHPLNNLDTLKHRIAPTEYDTYWRGKVLKGYVHDPTAALFGGEAGSAGLFGNVHDLGVFYQMLLNRGTYGGKRYLQPSTVDLFTRHQPGCFRGLGFNKPTGQPSSTKAIDCPTTAYGHTGFTGICVWVDPKNDLIFVFASNRVHPSPTNNKINTKAIRARMHQVFYNQILDHPEIPDTTAQIQ